MILQVITYENKYGDASQVLLADGKEIVNVHNLCECPEDATIYRDLINCNHICDYIKMGYDLAKKGENLEFLKNEIKPYDER